MSNDRPLTGDNPKPWFKKKRFVIPIALLVLGVIGGATGGNNSKTSSANTSANSSNSTDSTPSASPAALPEYSAAEIKNATASMYTQTDPVKGNKFIYDRTSPHQFYTTNNAMYLYAGINGGAPYLKFRINYFASDWLFVQSYVFNVDGEVFTIDTNYGDVNTDNGIVGGDSMVWEWWDGDPTSENLDMLKKIANSKKTLLRYEGRQYHHDRTITAQEKLALKHMLIYFSSISK